MPSNKKRDEEIALLESDLELSRSVKSYSDGNSGYETFIEHEYDIRHRRNESALAYLTGSEKVHRTSSYKRATSAVEQIRGITLTWENINVFAPLIKQGTCGRTYTTKGEDKQLLYNVTGIARSGTLLAVMGASGAGKSTLLNVLTQRNKSNLDIQGTIKINGQQLSKGIKALSAYVQQDDLFVGTLKVREHLWFQALLRMDKDISLNDRKIRVEEVIDEMGLSKCADDIIGIPGKRKGISGGEMKRLSFASEVLTNPPLMFCDEPTSGLDSFMAETVLRSLKAMAQEGKTIVCTIHQPSSEVFALFDQLLLLAEGRVSFLGPAESALDFFDKCGFPCPRNFNPADHFVHTLAIRPTEVDVCRKVVNDVHNEYLMSSFCNQVVEDIKTQELVDSTEILEWTDLLQNQSPYKSPWTRQVTALLWRCWLAQARDANVFAVRIYQTIIVAVIIAAVYFGQQLNQEGVMNINGALFLFLTNTTFSNFYTVLNSFPLELPIFYREHHNGMYRVDAYFLCKNIAEIPLFILLPTLFILINYFAIGLQMKAQEFFIAWLVVVLVCKAAVSCAYFVSTLSGRIDMALAVSNPAVLPLLLFGGFFLNQASIPVWLVWMQYLSWFRYANEILVVNQWKNVVNIDCPGNATTICYKDGLDVIEKLNFNVDSMTFNFLMLLTLIVGFRLLSFVCLWCRSKETRRK